MISRNLPCSSLQRDTHTVCQARRISRCFVILNRITNSTFSQPRAQILLLFVQSLVSPLPLSSPASLSSLSLSVTSVSRDFSRRRRRRRRHSVTEQTVGAVIEREGRESERASDTELLFTPRKVNRQVRQTDRQTDIPFF